MGLSLWRCSSPLAGNPYHRNFTHQLKPYNQEKQAHERVVAASSGTYRSDAFSLGIFSIRWYAICFVLGGDNLFWFVANRKKYFWKASEKQLDDLFFPVLIGCPFGARLGCIFGMRPGIFSPSVRFSGRIPMTGNFIGIAGLSFHGALLGAAAVIFWRVRLGRSRFLFGPMVSVRILPIGILFPGDWGILNGELWGRNTDMVWGMSFPRWNRIAEASSQLYGEMLGEGILLYLFLRWSGGKNIGWVF